MDGAFQVHLCLYVQICTQGRHTDMHVCSHVLYVCTETTRMQIKHQRGKEGRGDKRKNTGCSNPY